MNDGQLPAKVAELVVQLNQFNTLDDAAYSKDNPDFFGIMQRSDLNPKQFGFEE
jgi:glucan biosynthesis protein